MVERLLLANDEKLVLWEALSEAFYEKYFSESVRHQKETEFLEFTQESMSLAAYEAKFTELACFAPHIVIDETTRAHKFLRGLRP